jgi:hypothetical protein
MMAGLPSKARAAVKCNLERLRPHFRGGCMCHPNNTLRKAATITEKK